MDNSNRRTNGEKQVYDPQSVPKHVLDHWRNIVSSLPLPPASFGSITAVSEEEMEPNDWVKLISNDPVLTGKVIAVANSAAMGLKSPITDIKRAVVHLGNNLTRVVVVGYFLEGVIGKWKHYPRSHFDHTRKWTALMAVFSHHIAESAFLTDSDTITTASLLARIGGLILGLNWPGPGDEYRNLANELDRVNYEMSKWQINTAILSNIVARHWSLPEPLPTLVGNFLVPFFEEVPKSKANTASTLIAISSVLAINYLHDPEKAFKQFVDDPAYATLHKNMTTRGLTDIITSIWNSNITQIDLAVVAQ